MISAEAGALVAPGERGTTTIADRVVAKIAAQAASEIDHVGGRRPHVLGVGLPVGDEQRPRVDAEVDGRLARLEMSVVVEYPAPVRLVTRQVREAATARVRELAGVEVKEVDITVVALARHEASTRRVR